MSRLPSSRPADLALHFGAGNPRYKRLLLEVQGSEAIIRMKQRGDVVGEVKATLTPAEFDALYAALLKADLPRLESPLWPTRGARVHDHDGPSLELTWSGGRFSLNESGFRFNDKGFDTIADHLRCWAKCRAPQFD